MFSTDISGQFSLKISDNGKGFEIGKIGNFTNGIKNIRGRCAELNYKCSLNTAEGRGTCWEITGKFELLQK
jgi:signal transduction histidine kinase